MQHQNCTAIKALLLLSALSVCLTAWAGAAVGTVTDLAGALLAKRPDGSVRILSGKSAVEEGDTLVTEKESYARIRFTDASEVILKPNSQFRIDKFSYSEDKKENDSALFSLVKGGLRSVTGLVGKRSQDRFGLTTPVATIGVRGTTFIAQYVPPPQGGLMPAPGNGSPSLTPGLHVSVTDGAIIVNNRGGSQGLSAGQFGFTPNITVPPVVVPANPAMSFSPPPAFSTSLKPGAGGTGAAAAPKAVDCEVR